MDDPRRLLGRPGGDRRPPARLGVAAELLEVLVAEGADLGAPQARLAEQQHHRQIAAAAPGAPVGHSQEPLELRPTQRTRRPAADGVRLHPLNRRVDALCFERDGEAAQRRELLGHRRPGAAGRLEAVAEVEQGLLGEIVGLGDPTEASDEEAGEVAVSVEVGGPRRGR